MAYYREHALEGRDEATLADLRARSAAVLSRELGREVDVETMMGAIRFRAYPDAAPALAALRDRGLRLLCVSNWDVSLPRCSTAAGSRRRSTVLSPRPGRARRSPTRYLRRGARACRLPARRGAARRRHEAEDVAGARAAGVPGLLLDRQGGGQLASLAEIEDHLRP